MEPAERSREEFLLLQKAERILSQVRPFFQREGSRLSIKDCREGTLTIVVSGACVGCALATQDLGDVTRLLQEELPEVKKVCYVNPYGLPI